MFILAIIGAYTVYKPFMLSITVAVLLSIATFNLTKYLTNFTGSAHISATISTLLLMVLMFAPMVYLATRGMGYMAHFDSVGIKDTIYAIKDNLNQISFMNQFTESYLNEEQVSTYIKESTSYITSIGGASLGFMKNMFFVIIFYFFINYYGNRFFDTLLELLPVSSEKGSKMIQEVSATMEVVFYSVIVTAIFEGFLFGIL